MHISQPKKDFFANKAKEYDQKISTRNNVSNIASCILKEVNYSKNMHLMDFGSGTGLLLTEIAPHVNSITAVDVSKSMTAILKEKRNEIDCSLKIREIDLTKETINTTFDGIISSMTLHHIKDTKGILQKFYTLLKTDGSIALSDLDSEDGSFHTEDTGVFHFGFNRDTILQIAKSVGFRELKIQTVGNIEKPHGNYGVFLLTGKK
ncbi:MAG: SAM-dependent methyltransferase [Flavobacteriaceae bacterium]|nr:MAG: SAM-dependent methyltransferase [Flavobacteriaceae bacterium]